MLKFVKSTWWMRAYSRHLVWNLPNDQKKVYLTFDDGPTPQITPWVLDQLDQHNAKGTFFLIGKNSGENPELLQRLIDSKHSIGNHTQNHFNGWKYSTKDYAGNFKECERLTPTHLFRPPYGKIKRSQIQAIKDTHKIIMWDIITYDFDENTSAEDCFGYIRKHVTPGSIIVFHDSQKAWPNLEKALPKALQYLNEQGYKMEAIP